MDGIIWGGIIAMYHLGAVKREVCPMVEASDSFKKEKQ